MLIAFPHQLHKAGQRTHWLFCTWVSEVFMFSMFWVSMFRVSMIDLWYFIDILHSRIKCCKDFFFYLRDIAKCYPHAIPFSCRKVYNIFVFYCIHYCNVLLTGVSKHTHYSMFKLLWLVFALLSMVCWLSIKHGFLKHIWKHISLFLVVSIHQYYCWFI